MNLPDDFTITTKELAEGMEIKHDTLFRYLNDYCPGLLKKAKSKEEKEGKYNIHELNNNMVSEAWGNFAQIPKLKLEKALLLKHNNILIQNTKPADSVISVDEGIMLSSKLETTANIARNLLNKYQKAKKQLEEQKPLLDHAKRLLKSDSLTDLRTVAKVFKIKHIFKFLEYAGVIHKKYIKSKNKDIKDNACWVPYKQFIDNGCFEVREDVYEYKPDKYSKYAQTLVTSKGELYISKLLDKLKEKGLFVDGRVLIEAEQQDLIEN
jgi:phage antirepressor YoqD-like protein